MSFVRTVALRAMLTACVLMGCGSGAGPSSPSAELRVVASGLVSAAQVTRVTASVSPAGLSQDLTYDAASGIFSGALTVAVGVQQVRADAYALDRLVGSGSASVTVQPGQVAVATIAILDTSGPPAQPDHAPVVTSCAVPSSALTVGDRMTVSCSAVDVDGDAVAYAWQAVPAGCGSFSTPGAASATFTALAAGACTLVMTVTARGNSDARSVALTIAPASGGGTRVPGGDVSGHWTLAGSPYLVTGHIQVPKGSRLTIDPGVRVEFQGPYRLRLYGGLSAVGTSTSRVVFTTTAADVARGASWVGWLGIRIPGDDYDDAVIDHGPGLYDLRFCEIAYVDKNGGVQSHPWEDALGSFYSHGVHNGDLVFDDNWAHHGRSSLVAIYGASASALTAPLYFNRNVFENPSDNPAVAVAHVYYNGGAKNQTHFVGGAVRHFIGTPNHLVNGYATVVDTWDSPVYLDQVEVTDCGDQAAAPWFVTWNAGASVMYTPP